MIIGSFLAGSKAGTITITTGPMSTTEMLITLTILSPFLIMSCFILARFIRIFGEALIQSAKRSMDEYYKNDHFR